MILNVATGDMCHLKGVVAVKLPVLLLQRNAVKLVLSSFLLFKEKTKISMFK